MIWNFTPIIFFRTLRIFHVEIVTPEVGGVCKSVVGKWSYPNRVSFDSKSKGNGNWKFLFWTKWSFIWLKIERKTITKIIYTIQIENGNLFPWELLINEDISDWFEQVGFGAQFDEEYTANYNFQINQKNCKYNRDLFL